MCGTFGESSGRGWKDCREIVGRVWRDKVDILREKCAGSVGRMWKECWESVGRVWEEFGESVGIVWGRRKYSVELLCTCVVESVRILWVECGKKCWEIVERVKQDMLLKKGVERVWG